MRVSDLFDCRPLWWVRRPLGTWREMGPVRHAVIVLAAIMAGVWCGPVGAADMAAREVTEALVKATPDAPADLSTLDLTYLDLSGLDFKAANLADADLYGTDFTSANLANADLSHTRLDRSVLIRANLAGAKLSDATILRPTVFSDMRFDQADAPSFRGADMTRVRVQARLDGADFSDANLTEADFSPLEDRAGEGTITTVPRNELTNARFFKARLVKANLSRAIVRFADLRGADLSGANLREAELVGSDMEGADLTGADVTGADFGRVNLKGVKGLDMAIGLGAVRNMDTAQR